MAERYQSQLMSMQPVQSNAPQLFQSLAARLNAFSNEQENQLDREMTKKAKEQGLIDAQGKTAITLRDGSTIADEAWNEGATASHIAAVKLDISENMTRIEGESAKNPEAYTVKAKAYSQGLLEGVPEGIRPAVQNELAGVMLDSTQRITSDLRSFERDQHGAQVSTAVDLYRADAENKAKVGDLIGATDAQFSAIELTNSMEVSGLLTPKAAQVQRLNITRDVEDQAIYGEFSRQLSEGKGVSFLNKFKALESLGDRRPEYRKKMQDEMISLMNKAHAIDDNIAAQDEKARKEAQRVGLKEVITLDLEGQLTTEILVQMVNDETLSPKDAKSLEQSASLDGPEYSDPQELNNVRSNLMEWSEVDITSNISLSKPDRGALIKERRALEEDKGNWRRTQAGSEGTRRINQAFGIIAGVDTRITREKAQRAGSVLTRYYNEVEALPLEDREAKSTEVADRLVKEVNGEINTSELKAARTKLLDFDYQTPEEIDAADLGSEEAKTYKMQLERLQRKVQRLENDFE